MKSSYRLPDNDRDNRFHLKRIFTEVTLNRPLWIILSVVSLLSTIDIAADFLTKRDEVWPVAGIVCFSLLKATLLTFIWGVTAGSIIRRHWLRVTFRSILCLIILLYVLLSLANGIGFALYGFGISRKMALIALQTNAGEVSEFLTGLFLNLFNLVFSLKSLIIVVACGAVAYIMLRLPRKWFRITVLTICACGTLFTIWFMTSMHWGRTNLSVFARTIASVRSVMISIQRQQEYMRMLRPLDDAQSLSSDHLADNIVVVIGESASRGHLSIYGYPLPTTPRFDAMSDTLVVFTDVLASSTTTAENIPRLVTFQPDTPAESEWYEYPSAIDVFKTTGYKTAWISNQERSGIWNNVSSALSSKAEHIEYVGSEDSEDHLLDKYDEAVLNPFYRFITGAGERHFAIVHLMGSHTEYSRRYPPTRGKFKGDDITAKTPRPWLDNRKANRVAEYDNSILYTDSILACIVRTLANSGRPSLMFYVSDHGENVYDTGDFCGRDTTSVTVPLIVYANRQYRENNPDLFNVLQSSCHRPLSSSRIIHMILSLSGTRYSHYQAESDVTSPLYAFPPRYVDGEKH